LQSRHLRAWTALQHVNPIVVFANRTNLKPNAETQGSEAGNEEEKAG